jgi:hypothetical protein
MNILKLRTDSRKKDMEFTEYPFFRTGRCNSEYSLERKARPFRVRQGIEQGC